MSTSPASLPAAAAAASQAEEVDVLIVGGGPAGLAAALELESLGRSYLILEARSRLGGRVLTSTELGTQAPVDVGASWMHHFTPRHPLAHLAWQSGAALGTPAGGATVALCADGSELRAEDHAAAMQCWSDMEEARVAEQSAHDAKCHAQCAFANDNIDYKTTIASMNEAVVVDADCAGEDITSLLRDRSNPSHTASCCAATDQSLASWIAARPELQSRIQSLSPSARGLFDSMLQGIEHLEGASLQRLSVMHAGYEQNGVPHCDMQFAEGYGLFLEQLAAQRLVRWEGDTLVRRVRYGLEGVEVHARKLAPHERPMATHSSSAAPAPHPLPEPHTTLCDDVGEERVYRAKYCLMTAPLGVLRAEPAIIQFDPPLPRWKRDAMHQLGYGLLNKVILKFPSCFWQHSPLGSTNGDNDKDHSEDPPVNLLQVLCTDRPLWIMNMSRALQAAGRMRRKQKQNGEGAHGPAWQRYMRRARPLVHEADSDMQPSVAGEDELGQQPSVAFTAAEAATRCTSDNEDDDEEDPASSEGPHVLVAFYHDCDSQGRLAAEERRSDAELIADVMRDLRRAFQGGVESKVDDASQLADRQIHRSTLASASSVAATTLFTPAPAEGQPTGELELSHAFRFDHALLHCRPAPARPVPDPSAYVITRWGLDPLARGSYAHYVPGSGPHTCARIAAPVAVQGAIGQAKAVEAEQMSSDALNDTACATRLLFAGEATLGATLGCVDSAWISGIREAKRVQKLWAKQEHSSNK